jgi:hypothetical protein
MTSVQFGRARAATDHGAVAAWRNIESGRAALLSVHRLPTKNGDTTVHRLELADDRELASAIGRGLSVAHDGRSLRLRVENGGAPNLVRRLPVEVRVADGPVPSILGMTWKGEEISLEVEPTGGQSGRVTIPIACEPLAAIERPRASTRR